MSKEWRHLSAEEMEDRGVEWGDEIYHDLHRSAKMLSKKEQETVKLARDQIMRTLDLLTSSTPAEVTEEWAEWALDLVKAAMYARNCTRAVFVKASGDKLPESWERLEGSLH